MISSKTKSLVIVFALLLVTGFTTVGCKQKTEKAWVNTNSLPGNTFAQHTTTNSNARPNNPKIVYLGNDSTTSSYAGFGPKDVNFDVVNAR